MSLAWSNPSANSGVTNSVKSGVAYLYQPLHPSVLRCLSHIAKTAARVKKPVRVCGEISANPFYATLLLGMGFTRLSMNSLSIPLIRRVAGAVSMNNARKIARKALTLKTSKDIYEYLTQAIPRIVSADINLDSWAAEINPDFLKPMNDP